MQHFRSAVTISLSAAQASALLDADTRVLYVDLIEAALGDAARKAFEMLPQNYEFQGPTFKKGKLEGKLEGRLEGRLEGKLEGRLEGKLEGQIAMAAAIVLDLLEARGFTVSDQIRVRVQSSTDLEQLRRWVRRAAVITNADELFEE